MRSSLLGQILNKTPVAYSPRGASLLFPTFGRSTPEAQMRAMGNVGTLFAIAERLSTAVASVDWHLYRKSKSGKPEDRVEVLNHLALDLLSRPNKFYTRQELMESVQQHIDLVGEGWLVIGRDSRATLPLELWPVRPDRMEPIPDPDEFIKGYAYRGPSGETVPLGINDVMMIRKPNPLDPYRGLGAVQSVLTELDSVKYAQEWNRNFFLNSAEPGGIIQFDHRLSDAEFDEVTNRWREQHQGVSQAHRVAVIEQGQWVDRKITQKDMQFTEGIQIDVQLIRGAFGIPKFAVGDIDDVNRATADASRDWFARHLTVPRLDRWKQLFNFDYLRQFGAAGQGLEFDYDSPVPEDEESERAELTARVDAAVKLVAAGWSAPSVQKAYELPDDLEFEGKPEPPPGPAGPPAVPPPDGEPPAPGAVVEEGVSARLARIERGMLALLAGDGSSREPFHPPW